MVLQLPVFRLQLLFCVLVAALSGFSFTSFAQMGPAKHWDRTYGSEDWDELCSFLQTPDGGYILAGYTDGQVNGDKTAENQEGTPNIWLIKLDATVKKVWDKTISAGEDGIRIQDINLTADGGFVMGGVKNYYKVVVPAK